MKRYLCHDPNIKTEGFLIEAGDIQRAKQEAKQWNMTVDAIWYDHPANKSFDEE